MLEIFRYKNIVNAFLVEARSKKGAPVDPEDVPIGNVRQDVAATPTTPSTPAPKRKMPAPRRINPNTGKPPSAAERGKAASTRRAAKNAGRPVVNKDQEGYSQLGVPQTQVKTGRRTPNKTETPTIDPKKVANPDMELGKNLAKQHFEKSKQDAEKLAQNVQQDIADREATTPKEPTQEKPVETPKETTAKTPQEQPAVETPKTGAEAMAKETPPAQQQPQTAPIEGDGQKPETPVVEPPAATSAATSPEAEKLAADVQQNLGDLPPAAKAQKERFEQWQKSQGKRTETPEPGASAPESQQKSPEETATPAQTVADKLDANTKIPKSGTTNATEDPHEAAVKAAAEKLANKRLSPDQAIRQTAKKQGKKVDPNKPPPPPKPEVPRPPPPQKKPPIIKPPKEAKTPKEKTIKEPKEKTSKSQKTFDKNQKIQGKQQQQAWHRGKRQGQIIIKQGESKFKRALAIAKDFASVKSPKAYQTQYAPTMKSVHAKL